VDASLSKKIDKINEIKNKSNIFIKMMNKKFDK
jgi:hypothetical protein